MSEPESSSTAPLLVACLCAAWCTTCDAYRPRLAELAGQYPQARFVWVDIEDHADALEAAHPGGPEIENFPTLLVLRAGAPVFFGTVLPHPNVLERLLQEAPRRPLLTDAVAQALARGVLALAAAGQVPL
jgi:thiol-disulfide isomerase/thioredoxin